MFGYIIINKDEMKFKDFEKYRSYYCGLCQILKDKYKRSGQITLSYDMTFLAILLTALYEDDTTLHEIRCIAHPLEKHQARTNQFTDYAADMNILLSYYKYMDDWNDEKKKRSYAMAKFLAPKVDAIRTIYPDKVKLIEKNLAELSKLEEQEETDLDHMAGLFGQIMAELFVYQEDIWAATLREMGFFMGKFIYLCDAYEDIEKDKKSKNYNPFLSIEDKPDFQETCYQILTLMMASCSKAFEMLPILEEADILRNILYSGIWTRYYAVNEKRKIARETS